MTISPELITAFIAGIFGFAGGVTAQFSNRKRTAADAEKLLAEAAKLAAESEKIREETASLKLQNKELIEALVKRVERHNGTVKERSEFNNMMFSLFASSQHELLLENWKRHLLAMHKIDDADVAILERWRIQQDSLLADIMESTGDEQTNIWIDMLVQSDSSLPPILREVILSALSNSPGFLERQQLVLPDR